MVYPCFVVAALLVGMARPIEAQRPPPAGAIRFASFNASLNRERSGDLARDLADGADLQARNVAEIIQRVRPHILLVNEFDYDPGGLAVTSLLSKYLAVGQSGAAPINFPFSFSDGVNTGVPSGHDLDGDGKVSGEPGTRGYGNDAFGFGLFPGQYGMVIYSRFPIDRDKVRRFGRVLWRDMPGALLPTKPDGSPWYSADALGAFRLSSKEHWDVPIAIGPGGRTVHVLASHPTPPAFDGPEDRNGRRNHDEIRLWADYLTGGAKAAYLGPEAAGSPPARFVIMGDLNADPVDGGSVPGSIGQLLDHPKVDASFMPTSAGAAEAGRLQGQANESHKAPHDRDTADFDDRSVGNLRADYVLPSKGLKVVGGGVFWPAESDPLARLVRMTPAVASSDHRLVYLDIAIDEGSPKR